MTELRRDQVYAGHRIEELCGRGGMGVVYRAIHLELDRPVALKLIAPALAEDPDFRARFKRESRLAASLDHPNVIPVYGAGEAEGGLFLTMRFVPGTDMANLIAAEGMIEPRRAVAMVSQVAGALDAAHARGLVHRDVKPANILIVGDGRPEHVYLTDFGLTRDTTVAGGLTQSGMFVGSIDYAAPEQIEGKPTGAGADVYSLGCVLFHAVTGQRPYERDSDVAKLFAHLHEPPPSVTDLLPSAPSIFDDVIRRALAKDPAERYASAGDLARAAAAALEEREASVTERVVATGPAATGTLAPDSPDDSHTRVRDESTRVHQSPTAVAASEATNGAPPSSGGGGEPPGGGSDPGPVPRRGPDRRLLIGGIVAGVVVLAIALALVLGGGGDDSKDKTEAATPAAEPAAPAEPAAKPDSAWRELAPARTARQQIPAVVSGGAIWMAGGLTENGATSTVEGYDPVLNSWKSAPDLPVPLHHLMGVAYHDELVVLGGWIPEGANLSATVSNRVFMLRDGTEWTELPPMKHARAAAAAAVVDDKIVVVGGQAEGKLVSQTEIFDGKKWTEGAQMPTLREHLAAAADKRYVYAVGGRDLSSDANFDAVERYDPATDKWTKLPSLPAPQGGLGATVAGGQLIVAGSEEPTTVPATVVGFDIGKETWSEFPDLRTPRHGVGVASLGNTVYVLGGAQKPGHLNSAKTAEALDLEPAG